MASRTGFTSLSCGNDPANGTSAGVSNETPLGSGGLDPSPLKHQKLAPSRMEQREVGSVGCWKHQSVMQKVTITGLVCASFDAVYGFAVLMLFVEKMVEHGHRAECWEEQGYGGS